ncbi:Interstitial collagenase [Orchesella cincta]|uniref:Interstitial collagenase n=1 Tax=Orchesella cincta TaxID=48709 RepID=A0A1D2MFG3_ORCCI|nr:Interstitial collagenase [Orchesella cincta]
MANIIQIPHPWNRNDPKISRNNSSNVKKILVTFILVFYIFITRIDGTSAAPAPFKKETPQNFEWLELDPSLYNQSSETNGSQPLQFCIMDDKGIPGIEIKSEKDKATLTAVVPLFCRNETEETRYMFHGSKWKNASLTYQILSYPPRLVSLVGYGGIDAEIEKAFAEWEDVSNLIFTRSVYGFEGDINIRFLSGDHRDANDSDTHVAHAFYPDQRGTGDIYFNDDLKWKVGNTSGYDIFQTAVHKIGHTLGLGHFRHEDSVMCNTSECSPSRSLHSDDIKAIQIIYGKKSQKPKPESVFLSWFTITSVGVGTTCFFLGVILAVGIIRIIRCAQSPDVKK